MPESIILNFEKKAPGYYILFNDGTFTNLSFENIKKINETFWIKNNRYLNIDGMPKPAFTPCGFCLNQKNIICIGIKPFIPILKIVDKYKSYEIVSIVYKKNENEYQVRKNVSLQTALELMAFWSITDFCSLSKIHHEYFANIDLNKSAEERAKIIFKNMFAVYRGNLERTREEVSKLSNLLHITTENKIKRLEFISESDALLNAFVKSIIPIQILETKFNDIYEGIVGEKITNKKFESNLNEDVFLINSEHEEIIKLVQAFKKEVEKESLYPNEKLKNILEDLVAVIERHFWDEEMLIKKVDHAFYMYHHNGHRFFLKKIRAFYRTFLKLNKKQVEEHLESCEKWLSEHVNHLDQEFINDLYDRTGV